ncbi:hypothetical protein B6S44_26390 [Bosea sp. Tri-44]|uniref:hypothetical protein n=1 Tax=Bosea sp. Tri-44 TaxID=1972137 RepID=UPI00100EE0D2|nr:hypothetical protein [Bosea sp. Tri-44]RXT46347.1 hypothetical protein B6S44_26390 [Bosea sp. Tri-44]
MDPPQQGGESRNLLLAREGYRALFVETDLSDLDRVARFSREEQLATIKRLRPSANVMPPAPDGGSFMTDVVHMLGQHHDLKPATGDRTGRTIVNAATIDRRR